MRLESYLKIMDVASELRRAREAAKKQLDISEEKQAVRERIMQSAEITGETLTESEVTAAIEAFYRGLYRFKRPKRGLSYVLAKAYICRPVFYSFVFIPLVLGGVHFASPSKSESLLADTEARLAELLAVAEDKQEAQLNYDKLSVACSKGGSEVCSAFTKRFEDYADFVLSEYQIKVVNEPGSKSGIDRYYLNGAGENLSGYYLIVEALDPSGRRISKEIRNRETGEVQRVRRWGELVTKEIYDRISKDKSSDGIVDESLFAFKELGANTEELQFSLTVRGQITKW